MMTFMTADIVNGSNTFSTRTLIVAAGFSLLAEVCALVVSWEISFGIPGSRSCSLMAAFRRSSSETTELGTIVISVDSTLLRRAATDRFVPRVFAVSGGLEILMLAIPLA